jgi:hypothetical protein
MRRPKKRIGNIGIRIGYDPDEPGATPPPDPTPEVEAKALLIIRRYSNDMVAIDEELHKAFPGDLARVALAEMVRRFGPRVMAHPEFWARLIHFGRERHTEKRDCGDPSWDLMLQALDRMFLDFYRQELADLFEVLAPKPRKGRRMGSCDEKPRAAEDDLRRVRSYCRAVMDLTLQGGRIGKKKLAGLAMIRAINETASVAVTIRKSRTRLKKRMTSDQLEALGRIWADIQLAAKAGASRDELEKRYADFEKVLVQSCR